MSDIYKNHIEILYLRIGSKSTVYSFSYRKKLYEEGGRWVVSREKSQSTMSIRDAIEKWLLESERVYGQRTLKIYRQTAEIDIIPYIGNLLLEELEEKKLTDFFDLLNSRVKSDTSIKNVYTVLNGAYKCALSHGYLAASPLLGLNRKDLLQLGERKERRRKEEFFLSHEQAARAERLFLSMADPENTALYLCLKLGVTLKIISALRWGDIDLSNARVIVSRSIVRAESRDAKGVQRFSMQDIAPYTVPIPRDVLAHIEERAGLYSSDTCYVATGTEEYATAFNRLQVLLRSYNQRHNIAPTLTVEALSSFYVRRCLECGVSAETVCAWTGRRFPNQLKQRFADFIPDDVELANRLLGPVYEFIPSDTVRRMNLLILGAGDHGHAVLETAQAKEIFDSIRFLDDDPRKTETIGACADYRQYLNEYPIAFPAFGDNELRREWLSLLEETGFIVPNLISPSAYISPSVSIGGASIIEARATVGTGVRIGRGAIVSSNVTLDVGAVVGDMCYIAPGLTIPKRCVLPDGAHVDAESLHRYI